jgi:hypothetical protein
MAQPVPRHEYRSGPAGGLKFLNGTDGSGEMCTDIHVSGRKNSRRDTDVHITDPRNSIESLRIPVHPPYFKPLKIQRNSLGLPIKTYYTLGDLCKVLKANPDTVRYRFRQGIYPEKYLFDSTIIFS